MSTTAFLCASLTLESAHQPPLDASHNHGQSTAQPCATASAAAACHQRTCSASLTHSHHSTVPTLCSSTHPYLVLYKQELIKATTYATQPYACSNHETSSVRTSTPEAVACQAFGGATRTYLLLARTLPQSHASGEEQQYVRTACPSTAASHPASPCPPSSSPLP